MPSKMLKHRYFYPTKFFFAKYDIIVHDFFLYLPDKIFKIQAVTFYF